MPTTSTNMGLTVPVPSSGASGSGDPGPGYATNISNDLATTIDQHDHSFGKGVQITPAGLNISADLPIGSNNVTAIRGARFTSQASGLNLAGDINELYVKLGDLWYVNGSGVQVQLTTGGGLGTGPVGSTGPAGTSFVSNYFQAGVTGATACAFVSNLITWNNPLAQAGSISQPTSLGTGAGWVNITQAGLYDVSYAIGITGLPEASVTVSTYQTINATGATPGGSPIGGTAIPASAFYSSGGWPTGAGLVARGRYVVQLAAGNNIETWMSIASSGSKLLTPTGTLFTITKIG